MFPFLPSNSKYDISKYSLQRTTSGGSSITSTISNKLSSLKLTKSSDSTLAISNFINDSRPYYEPPLSISRSPKISPKLKLRNMSNSPENNFSGHSSFSHSLPTLANYGNPGTLNLHAGQIEGTTDNSDIKIFYDEHHNMAKVFTPLLDKLKNDMQKKASSSSSSSSTNGAPFDSRESKAAMDTLRLKFEVAHKHIPGIADKILDKLILKMEDFSKHGMSKNVVEYSRQKMPRHYSSSSSGQGSDVQQNQNLTMSLVNSNISGSSHASHHTSSSQHSKSSAYRTSSTQSNSSDHSGSISSSISQSTAGPGFSRNSASFHGVRSKPSLIHSNSYNSSQPQRTYSYKNGGGRTGASGTDERGNTSTSDRIDRLVDRESSGSGSRKIHGHKTLSQSRSDAVYASRTRSLLSRK